MAVKVKICGLKSETEIGIMNELRPDYVGFIFDPHSKKFIAPEHAKYLKSKLKRGILSVGVFVNEHIETVVRSIKIAQLDCVQLDGDESEKYINALKATIKPVPVIRTFKIQRPVDTDRAIHSSADYIMLDGGEGTPFEWSMTKIVERPYFLSGGLNPDNIYKALELKPQPFAVDVNTGVDANRMKDYRKVMKFILTVRGFVGRGI